MKPRRAPRQDLRALLFCIDEGLISFGNHRPVSRLTVMKQVDELYLPRKIISGGQTGVDRAALDVAIALDLAHGGWCPAGRLAEDGTIPEIYQLRETPSADYAERTMRNVLDSSATLILYWRAIRGGTRLTMNIARRADRPLLLVDLAGAGDFLGDDRLRWWLNDLKPETLNVAGPRESNHPGIYALAKDYLANVLCQGNRTND